MIKKTTLTILSVIFIAAAHAATFTIFNSGLSFSPAVVNAVVGDTIIFSANGHPTLEVSQTTWNANGTTPLPGGFSFPSGSGQVILTSAGTRFYVCTLHIGAGMKGQINVTSPSSIGNIITAMGQKGMVYPSPATGPINIIAGSGFTNKNVTLRIFDMAGRMVHAQDYLTGMYGDIITDVSFLRQGIYLAEVKAAEVRRVFRFEKRDLKN